MPSPDEVAAEHRHGRWQIDRRTIRSSSQRGTDPLAWPVLDDRTLAQLAEVGRRVQTGPDEVLWEAGEAYDLSVVLSGAVALVDRRDGRAVFVIEPGDFVGELGMLMGQPAFLAGVTIGDCSVLRVGVDEMRRLLSTSAELGDLLIAALDARRRLLTRLAEGGLLLVGDDDDPHLQRLREFADRNVIPFRTVLRSDSAAWSALSATTASLPETGTALITGSGRVRTDPTTRDLAQVTGLDLDGLPERASCDLLIVGAGPAGLAAAVYGASEGLDVVVVEDVAVGGQAGTSSRIENYLGFAQGVSGRELARSALIQAVKFGARIVSPRSVTDIRRDDQGFQVRLDGRTDLHARSVVVASGVRYRRLDDVPGLADLEGRGVFYAATEIEARVCADRQTVIVGGANSAGQAALFLAQRAQRVHVLIRRDDLSETMSTYLAERLTHHPAITVHPRSHLTGVAGTDRLRELTWWEGDHQVREPAGGLFVMIGAVPRTEWLRSAGVELESKGFIPTSGPFATSVPGLFAVGDVRAGSVKRVASAVGEGSMVVSAVHAHLASAGPS